MNFGTLPDSRLTVDLAGATGPAALVATLAAVFVAVLGLIALGILVHRRVRSRALR